MKKQIRFGSRIFCLVFVVLLCSGKGLTAERLDSQLEQMMLTGTNKMSAPYCGISCLYTILKLQGQDVCYRDLLRGDYIGSHYGSSIAELKNAAEDMGLFAYPIGNLTFNDLRQLRYPVILHVKRSSSVRQYRHYVLFLGVENDRIKLVDPPHIGYIGIDELLPRWNGSGLLVSARPVNRGRFFARASSRFALHAAFTLTLVLFFRFSRQLLPVGLFTSYKQRLGLSVGQGVVLGATALVFAFAYHFITDTGFLTHSKAIGVIQQAHAVNFIPKLNERKIHKLLGGDTFFIDARFARDFKAGHLKGAINLPVDANDVEHQKVTADIAKDAPIVLYCQSAGCKFAEIVAIKLIDDGFSDISIFRGGWNEWVAKNGKPKEVTI